MFHVRNVKIGKTKNIFLKNSSGYKLASWLKSFYFFLTNSTKKVCQQVVVNVPKQECKEVPHENCRDVPKKECRSVNEQQCADFTQQIPR